MTLKEVRALIGDGKRGMVKRLRAAGFSHKGMTRGAFRRPLGNDQWVVKTTNADVSMEEVHKHLDSSRHRRKIARKGCPPLAPTWIHGRYIIQRRYRTYGQREYTRIQRLFQKFENCMGRFDIDFHSQNVGLTKSGQVVMFDW